MVKSKNNEVQKAIQQITNLTTNDGKLPLEFEDKAKLVFPIGAFNNKFCDILATLTKTTTANGTIYTTPTDRDFYLSSVQISVIKDATCDDGSGTGVSIAVTINGVTTSVISIGSLALTAQNGAVSLNFIAPLKIDRGTTILLSGGSFTVGSKVRTGTISGFTYQSDITQAGLKE